MQTSSKSWPYQSVWAGHRLIVATATPFPATGRGAARRGNTKIIVTAARRDHQPGVPGDPAHHTAWPAARTIFHSVGDLLSTSAVSCGVRAGGGRSGQGGR